MQYKYAEIADTVYFWMAANETTGAAGDGATPLFDVRLAGAAAGAAPTASGTPTLLSHADYSPGLFEIAIDTTGQAAGEYAVFCTLTISTVNPAGFCGSYKLRTAATAIDPILDTVLVDTNELQGNQGEWATATGFATPTNITAASGIALAATQAAYAPAKAGDKMDLIDAPNATGISAIVAAINSLATYGLTALNTLLVTTGIKAATIPAATLAANQDVRNVSGTLPAVTLANGAHGGAETVITLQTPIAATVSGGATEAKQDTAKTVIDIIAADTTTDIPALIADLPTVTEFNARSLVAADYAIVSDLGVVQTGDSFALANSATKGIVKVYDDMSKPATAQAITAPADMAKETTLAAVAGNVTTIMADTDLLDDAAGGIADIHTDVAAVKAETALLYTAIVTNAAGVDIAADIIALKVVADVIAADTTTDIPALIASLDAVVDTVKVDTAAILIDTAVIGALGAGLTALADKTTLDLVHTDVDAILADTTVIGATGQGLTSLATAAELLKVPKSDSNVTFNATALASINAQVVDVLVVDTVAELAQGAPPATPTLSQAIMLPYMALRNQSLTTASELGIYNDAGTKIAKAALSDDGTTFTKAELVSGA